MDGRQITVIAVAVIALIAVSGTLFFVHNDSALSEQTEETEETVMASVMTYTAGSGYVRQDYTDVPERVVCGCSTFLNILLYFGLEDKVVGIFYDEEEIDEEYADRYSALIERIGADHDLEGIADRETVAGWKPDVILGWSSSFSDDVLGDADYWNGRGCNVWALESMSGTRTVNGMIYDYTNIGSVFGIKEDTKTFINEFKAKLSNVEGTLSENGIGIALYDGLDAEDLSDGALWMYGGDTFIGDILQHVGAENIYPGGGYRELQDVADHVDEIDVLFFVCYGDRTHDASYDIWMSNTGLAACPAFGNGGLKDIKLSLAYGGDPSVLEMLDNLETMFGGPGQSAPSE